MQANTKQALIDCLNEPFLGLSKSEIEQIMENEMNKPESEMDGEVVDLCIQLLAKMDHIDLPDENAVPPIPHPVSAPAKKRHRLRTVLVVAATLCVLLVSALIVSAEAFHFDLVHYTIEKFSGYVHVQPVDESRVLQSADELRRELSEYGFESVLLPEEFLAGATVTPVFYQETDVSRSVSFIVTKGDDELNIAVVTYDLDKYMPDSNISGDASDIREVPVDSTTALVLDTNDHRVIEFFTPCTKYSIFTSMDMDAAVGLAESMK